VSSTTAVDPLTRLAVKHGTDKWGQHFYTPIYHQLFAGLRELPVKVLEIGVGGYGYQKIGGASLAMWAEYFSHGHIVGVDISRKTLDLGPRVTVLQGSQTDTAFLIALAKDHGPFDIIIDDGSHVPRDMIATFDVLFSSIVDGGLYVLEDTQTAFWPEFGGQPELGGELYQWAVSILRGLNHAEIAVSKPDARPARTARRIRSFRAWHNLFIVEAGDNSEPSNHRYDAANQQAGLAMAMMRQALARKPTPEGYAELAQVHRIAGQLPVASGTIETGLKTWPKSMVLLVTGAKIASERHDPELARRLLIRALEIDPGDPQLIADLAAVSG
jgi:hypothetical protein